MKTLQLIKTSVGATWALRQMRELVKLGVDVHVAIPQGGPLIDAYREAGVHVHLDQFDFPLKKPWTLPNVLRRFRSLVDEVQPDVIHSHFVGTTLTMRYALGGNSSIPRVFQVPGPLHLEHAHTRQLEISSASPKVDSWIGSCQWTCDRYRQAGISADRIFLSYYGIDTEKFVLGAKGKLRAELGLKPETKIVGMVAYMYAPKRYLGQKRGLKGHEDLIDAVALCLQNREDVVCVFIGGAWNNAVEYEKQVRKYAQERLGEKAIFLGTRSDVSDLYADIDVVVHPSHSENVGGAAESLLLGIPTIATNVGGFPDLVRPGETGWLVPASSAQKLSAAILEALEDSATSNAMAMRGQTLARRLFDVQQNAKEINIIYKEVCHKNL